MDITIKNNLERRFSTLLSTPQRMTENHDFFRAEMAYVRYVSENKDIAKFVRKVLLENRIFPSAISDLFNAYVLMFGVKVLNKGKMEFLFPIFWDEILEDRFNLKKRFLDLITTIESMEELDAPKHRHWLTNNKKERHLLEIIRQLHNDLLEKIDEENLLTTKNGVMPHTDETNLEKIKHIIVVKETLKTKRFIVINKVYDEAIEIKGDNFSKHIKALANAIVNNVDAIETDDATHCKDFLNSHPGCRIYKSRDGKSQKYAKTKIVDFDSRLSGKKLEILNKIKTESITNEAFRRRLNDYQGNKQT